MMRNCRDCVLYLARPVCIHGRLAMTLNLKSLHGSIIATPMEDGVAKRTDWKSVGTYYVIACLWSWPFFWRRDVLHIPETNLPIHWALMWGPGIAALLCMAIFRRSHRRITTVFGDSWARSMFFYAAPFLVLALFRAHPLNGYNQRPLIAALTMFVSIFGEELGWRGFLQDALRPMPPAKRFGLIGLLWESWHFTTHIHGRVLVVLVLFYSLAVLLSFIIGYAVEYTHSIIVAVSLHAYVDVILQNPELYVALLIALPVLVLLLVTWPKPGNRSEGDSASVASKSPTSNEPR
jgi:membrane protease YdiL (CAAX protease family)